VIGDISSRRGNVSGLEDKNNVKIVHASVPLAEMFGYATELRSRTQGRGVYSMEVNHFEPVPKALQDKLVTGIDLD
jgi:elongation factor G